ncbi:MAG: hypothetical protein K1Y02_24300, partial [Candidatus Hydrogenedentes bacterium]|nr:hypothetical protein [Candidatus Hydrogenedentota bacterium]
DVFWIFGGYGIDENSQMGALNDVWKYDCSTGDWTWMKGAKQFNQKGQYGTQGVAESGSTPGGRSYAVAWKETLGTVWLFSGLGYDSAATRGYLNDLWAYDSSTNTWTWMKGPSISGQPGVYGELGVPAADNSPGGRSYAANWLDESGELWLFGGYGHDRVTDEAYLNDLWRLDTSTLTWTWMKGKALVNSVGTYGTKGTAALANTPGSRMYGVSWADTSGALWLFGGTGYGRTATPGLLNDLWRWADAQLPAYTVTFQTDDTEGAALIGVTSQTIVHGQNATPVSAEAPASHHFVRWSKGGAPYSTANPLTVTNVTAAMTLVANFAINLYSLKYTAGEHGVIQGTAEQWVNHGSSGSSVLAEAMLGYHFVTWSDGLLAAERIDTDVTASIDVTAEFAINQYTLSYSIQEHGTLIGLATQKVSHGDNGVPVTASAETGYHFVRWSDGVTENPRAEQNVTSDMSVSAEIGINQYALNYATEGDGSISGDTAQSVAYGGSGTAVTAVPGLGSHFVSWSDGSTANPRIDVNITEALSVAAVFALNEYALVYAAGPNGTISGPVNQTVAHGSSGAAVCAVPDPGYKFTLWSDGCASASRADQNVTGNIQVEAYFEIEVPPVIPVGRWTDLVLMFGFGILAVWRLIRARTNLSDGIKRGGW